MFWSFSWTIKYNVNIYVLEDLLCYSSIPYSKKGFSSQISDSQPTRENQRKFGLQKINNLTLDGADMGWSLLMLADKFHFFRILSINWPNLLNMHEISVQDSLSSKNKSLLQVCMAFCLYVAFYFTMMMPQLPIKIWGTSVNINPHILDFPL